MADTNMKTSIIVSVISSMIVLVFVRPILDLGWKLLSWGSASLYLDFLNSVYRNAALGQRDWLSVLLLLIVLSVALGISIAILTLPILRRLQEKKEKKGDNVFPKTKRVMKYIIWIVFMFAVICLIVYAYADLQLNTSFQQRLAVLSPKIGDLETKNLLASWALMESREDYENITLRMEEVAEKYKIKLPKLLLD